jgi:hypothetical protein
LDNCAWDSAPGKNQVRAEGIDFVVTTVIPLYITKFWSPWWGIDKGGEGVNLVVVDDYSLNSQIRR